MSDDNIRQFVKDAVSKIGKPKSIAYSRYEKERAEMQAVIVELRELLDMHTDPMDRYPIIDQTLKNTKKWSE